MIIIKEGRPPSETILFGTCFICGCEIKAAKKECSTSVSLMDRDEAQITYPCPTDTCKGTIIMKKRIDDERYR